MGQGRLTGGELEAGYAAYAADRELRRPPAYTRGGRMMNNPKKDVAKGREEFFDRMSPDEQAQWHQRAKEQRDYNNTPAGVPVADMLQTPGADAAKATKGEAYGANLSFGTVGKTATDRLIERSEKSNPSGVIKGDNGTRGGASVPVRTLTGPMADKTLPMGARMQSFNDATTANAWGSTGRVNRRNVINAGQGKTFNAGMDSTGAPRTAEGKLVNPGEDMATGMNYTKPDGTVLHYTRPGAGKGGPAPLRLSSVTRPNNDRVAYNRDTDTGAMSVTTANDAGGKTTHIYDGKSANLTGLGNPTGKTVENPDGSRMVYDIKTGRVVGSSSPTAGTLPSLASRQTACRPTSATSTPCSKTTRCSRT